MTHNQLITCIEDLHDAAPHNSFEWLAAYICARQTHFTLSEVKTAIIATIG